MKVVTYMRKVFLNGQFIAENEAQISIFDRSVQFADSVYEVLSVLDGKIIDFNGHLNRLDQSLEKLSMQRALNHSEWLKVFRTLIKDNALKEGIIYLQVTRGIADRDFHYPSSNTPLTMMAFTQAKILLDHPKLQTGLSIVTLPDKRWGRCDIKTTQLLYSSMMKMEAQASGADDAWLVSDNTVTEGTSNNAAIITHDDELITHKISSAILAGTTRNILLDLAQDTSLKVIERSFSLEEVYNAKEAFVSAASLFVMPVTKVDHKCIGSGLVGDHALDLRNKYIDWACKTSL